MIRIGLVLLCCLLPALSAAPALAQVGKTETQQAPSAGPANYLMTPKLRQRVLDALLARIGGADVSKLEIGPDRVTIWTRSPRADYLTDSFEAQRMKVLVLDIDSISGPRPTEGDPVVRRKENSFFELSDVALDRFDAVVAAARERAGFQTPGHVTSVTIARNIAIVPEPAYGEVRWTITLATDRESATVTTDATGNILGADLSQTIRGQRLDMIADDDWPMADAQRDLAAMLGDKRIYELRVHNTYVYIEAEHPQKDGAVRDYSWNLGGVRMGFEFGPLPYYGGSAPFAMSAFDLGLLPEIKRQALAAFDFEGAKITYIELEQPTDRAIAAPELVWSIDIAQPNGDKGSVLLDKTGKVLEVNLPESRQAAAEPWLAPTTIAATLERLGAAFGPDAKFAEILINDTQASILVEDPQAPGTMASFLMDTGAPRRFGTPMPWEAELDPAKVFTVADLAALDARTLAALSDRTLERMGRNDLAVFRYTISRSTLIMEPEDTRLLVEIRAGKDDGWTSGWVTFELDGSEADVMLP